MAADRWLSLGLLLLASGAGAPAQAAAIPPATDSAAVALTRGLYDTVLSGMSDLARAYPSTVELFDLGVNDEGRMIRGVRIGTGRSKHLIVGTHHGNERLSADVAMAAARKLARRLSDSSERAFGDLVGSEIYVIPVLNLAGYDANRREERDSKGRWFDPNRDYPDPCAVDKADFRLKSTSRLAEFVQQKGILGAVTIHGYIGTFTYPWGIYTDDSRTPDHDLFHSMGQQAVRHNGYHTGTHTDLIYPAAGAFEDWAYHAHGIWVMLLEIRRNANVDADAESLLAYFAAVPENRSAYHEHRGNCTNRGLRASDLPSRP